MKIWKFDDVGKHSGDMFELFVSQLAGGTIGILTDNIQTTEKLCLTTCLCLKETYML